jgi:O-antigen ligase
MAQPRRAKSTSLVISLFEISALHRRYCENIDMGTRLGHVENSKIGSRKQGGHNSRALARNLYAELSWACILAGLTAGLYSSSTDNKLWIYAILLATMVFLPARGGRMHPIDWTVLLLCAFEVPSVLFSQYRANSIRATIAIAVFALMYCVTRLAIRTGLQVAAFSGLLGLGGSYLACSGLSQFHENVKHLSAAGLTNLIAFRSRLISPPSLWIPGEWFTLLLLVLPFACVFPLYLCQKQKKWLAAAALILPVLITATLCLSMSRAVFWSVVVFCFLFCAFQLASQLTTLRTTGMLFGAALVALVLILAGESALCPGVFEAYTGQHTSQVRSTQGRFEIWNRSYEVIRAYPLVGVGSGNAALSLTSTAGQEETTGFASRTFSLPIQVLVEKGIVGFLLYCTFLILVARQFIRTMRYSPPAALAVPSGGRRKGDSASPGDNHQAIIADLSARKAMACCFAAGLVAVLFRELTYSSLFEHQLTLALVAVMSALVCLPESGK